MDILSVVGVILAFVAMIGGSILKGSGVKALLGAAAFVIVVIGTLAASCLQTPMATFTRAMKIVAWVFKPPALNPAATIEKIVEWSNIARKQGLLGLESAVEAEKDDFMKKGLQALVDGGEPEAIRNLLEIELEVREHADTAAAKVFEGMGIYAPTLGIIGAVMGLMAVMQNLNDPSKLGHGIAAAFIATLYGIGFANLFLLPMASKLKSVIHGQTQVRQMCIEGIISIAQGENPRNIEAKLKSYLHHLAAANEPMARKKKHEEHQNHEAWAIPYGDLVTLLFALFTVMYAMSSVNEGKYRVLSDSLVAAFRGSPKTTSPITTTKDAAGKGGDVRLSGMRPTALMKLRDPRPMANQQKSDEQTPITSGVGQTPGQTKAPGEGQGPGDLKSPGQGHGRGVSNDPALALFQMADEVRKALQGLIDKNLVHVRQTAISLEVEIKTDILFASGVAAVQPTALPVLEKVAEILKPFPNQIRVEGHTDNRPISTATFPSNWELSAARAANVVQLFTKSGVDPLRMEVLGLGEYRPVASNDQVEGRNSNRRVVIVVLEQKLADNGIDPVQPALDAGKSGEPVVTVLRKSPIKGKAGT